MTPMPVALGQMSLLISFICQVWWPFGSVGPSLSVDLHALGLWSRQ